MTATPHLGPTESSRDQRESCSEFLLGFELPKNLIEHYNLFRDYIKHEDELINQRSTWHLVIQGFLFATLGVLGQWQTSTDSSHGWSVERHGVACVLALVGLLIAFFARRSIEAAVSAGNILKKRWDDEILGALYEKCERFVPGLAGAGNLDIEKRGKQSALHIPTTIMAGWLMILGFTVADHFRSSQPLIQPTTVMPSPCVATLSDQETARLSAQQIIQQLSCANIAGDMLQKRLNQLGYQLTLSPFPPPDKPGTKGNISERARK